MFARAAITKYHRLGGLKNKLLLLQFCKLKSPKTRFWQDLVFGDGFLPGLQMAMLSLHLRLAFLCVPEGRMRE